MGGNGSGRWTRWNKKATTEAVKHIDIRRLHRQGAVGFSNSGVISWSSQGKVVASIEYVANSDRITLSYRYSIANASQGVEEIVRFDRTPCNYGGFRTWFCCPQCNRRVAILYLGGPRFLCRHCYRLPYGSQQEPYLDRMNRKFRRIRERLSATGNLNLPVWIKPKGMHWKTFECLRLEERYADYLASVAWVEEVRKVLPRLFPRPSPKTE